jgi:hypothetical protein
VPAGLIARHPAHSFVGSVEDLVTLQDISAHDAPFIERRDSFVVTFMVLWMTGFFVIFGTAWDARGLQFWASLWRHAAIGVPVGLVAGYLRVLADRHERKRKIQRRLERIFAADPALVPPAPPSSTHRLVCGIVISMRRAIGGMLYVRPGGLTFQPHYPRLRLRDRMLGRRSAPVPKALEIGPPRTIVLRQAVLKAPVRWRRPRRRPRPRVIVCTWEGGAAAFRVVMADDVHRKLQEQVDRMRGAS